MKDAAREYGTVWSRIYAPLRKMIAGTWLRQPGGNRYELSLDAYGSYRLRCLDTGRNEKGRYTIIGNNGLHYIALESEDGVAEMMRIDDVTATYLRLVDEAVGRSIDLSRRTLTA
jgi:hypothetical protein